MAVPAAAGDPFALPSLAFRAEPLAGRCYVEQSTSPTTLCTDGGTCGSVFDPVTGTYGVAGAGWTWHANGGKPYLTSAGVSGIRWAAVPFGGVHTAFCWWDATGVSTDGIVYEFSDDTNTATPPAGYLYSSTGQTLAIRAGGGYGGNLSTDWGLGGKRRSVVRSDGTGAGTVLWVNGTPATLAYAEAGGNPTAGTASLNLFARAGTIAPLAGNWYGTAVCTAALTDPQSTTGDAYGLGRMS